MICTNWSRKRLTRVTIREKTPMKLTVSKEWCMKVARREGQMSYDPKSYELAEYFLPSSASKWLKSELAQAIQTRVEDWLEYECAALAAKLGVPNPEID